MLTFVTAPNVLPLCPSSIRIFKVFEERTLLWIAKQEVQRTFAVVVVLAVQVCDRLSLHIGLPGEDEDLEQTWRVGGFDRRHEQTNDDERQAMFHEDDYS